VQGAIFYNAMDAEEQKTLRRKIAVLVPAVFLFLILLFFVPARTLDYWEAWVYCAVLLVPFLFVLTYLLRKDPEFLAQRIQSGEKESARRVQ
jgi:cell division protein FtsW (lipid II flippase)